MNLDNGRRQMAFVGDGLIAFPCEQPSFYLGPFQRSFFRKEPIGSTHDQIQLLAVGIIATIPQTALESPSCKREGISS
jgi:hypothetical protein